jgi:hypothetical protein
MNFARVAAAAVAAWVVSLPVGYVVNEILLKDIYTANAAALRPEAAIQANVPIGFVFTLVGFFAFAYAYAKGYEGTSGAMEGLRFGVLVAVLLICFGLIWAWVTTPIGGTMAAAMMVDAVAEFALYGAVVGAIYKPAAAPARRSAAV